MLPDLLLALTVFASGTAWAANSEWTNVGPQGTSVALLAFDPRDPATVYTGSGTGVFKSQDGGATWNGPMLNGRGVGNLLVHPQNSSIIYAQTSFTQDQNPVADVDPIYQVFKSVDGGVTWTDLVTDAILAAVDPQDPDTVYVFAGGYPRLLFKTTDAGATWLKLGGIPAGLHAVDMAIDPQNHNTVYLAAEGVINGRNVSTVYKSSDGGATWKESGSGLPQTEQFSFYGTPSVFGLPSNITIDSGNPSTLYVSKVATGVYKSTDAGATWRAANLGLVNTPTAFPPCCSTSVVIDGAHSNTLYVMGGNPATPMVYRSVNGGVSWSGISSVGAPGFGFLEIGPQSTLYFAGSTLRKSTDGGATWNALDLGLRTSPVSVLKIDPQSSGTLYTAGFKSTDGGTSWSRLTGIPQGFGLTIIDVAIDPQTTSTLYAAVDAYECGKGYPAGIYFSGDGGASWARTGPGPGCDSDTVAVDPQNPSTVYAGGLYGGVYKSVDAGASWTRLSLDGALGFAFDPNSGTVFARTSSGISKSVDGGASWSQILPSPAASLAIAPGDAATLYAATSNGLLKSTDGGTTWRTLSAASGNVSSVAIDPRNPATIYAGTDTGVVKSPDGGESWAAVPGAPVFVTVLALDGQESETLYAGGRSGLFATTVAPGQPADEH